MSMRDRIAKAILGGKVGGPTPSGIHVYHSSPHDFDRFDLSKIGTGEGAQVYGHGIYAAENPAVSGLGGQYWKSFEGRFKGEEGDAASFLRANAFDRDKAVAHMREVIARERGEIENGFYSFAARPGRPEQRVSMSDYDKQVLGKSLEARAQALKLLEGGAPVGPRTYEVNFKAKPEELLDWDKGLPRQSPYIKEMLDVAGIRKEMPNASGEAIYGALMNRGKVTDSTADLRRRATDTLLDAGIPGIRYLDEGSRSLPSAKDMVVSQPHAMDQRGWLEKPNEGWYARTRPGISNFKSYGPFATEEAARTHIAAEPWKTSNYVAFDPSRLDIMAKYGVVGGVPLGAATMGGTIDQSSYGASQ